MSFVLLWAAVWAAVGLGERPELTTLWAIGDLHGDAACARYWVSRTGLVSGLDGPPSGWAWTDEGAALVFVGDYIDKGPEAKAVLLFVRELTLRFERHVHAILGNHELNLLADRSRASGLEPRIDGHSNFRYLELAWGAAHPAQYASWLPRVEREAPETKAALRSLLDALTHVYAARKHPSVLMAAPQHQSDEAGQAQAQARAHGQKGSDASILRWIADPDERALAARELVRWQRAYLAGVSTGSKLGSWLESRPLTLVLADTLFVHGGVPAALVAGTRAPLGSQGALRALNDEFATRSSESELPKLLGSRPEVHELVEFRRLHGDCAQVAAVTAALGVGRVAVGHTPEDLVRVTCGGRLLALDSALGRWFRTAGNHYCGGEADERSSRGELICPRKAARCEGQVVRLARAGANGAGSEDAAGTVRGWAVTVIESDDSDGREAERWSAVGAAAMRAEDEAEDQDAETGNDGAGSQSADEL